MLQMAKASVAGRANKRHHHHQQLTSPSPSAANGLVRRCLSRSQQRRRPLFCFVTLLLLLLPFVAVNLRTRWRAGISGSGGIATASASTTWNKSISATATASASAATLRTSSVSAPISTTASSSSTTAPEARLESNHGSQQYQQNQKQQQLVRSSPPPPYSPCGDDNVLPGLPNINLFMIIGCAKCGTTTLQMILNSSVLTSVPSNIKKVELMTATGKRESMYFSGLCQSFNKGEDSLAETVCRSSSSNSNNNTNSSDAAAVTIDREACLIRNDYLENGLRHMSSHKAQERLRQRDNSSQFWLIDKTAPYIRIPGVATAVKRVVGGSPDMAAKEGGGEGSSHHSQARLKVAAILRDPVERLYSEYKYILSLGHGLRHRALVELMNNYTETVIATFNLTNFPTLNEFLELRTDQNSTAKELDDRFSFKVNKAEMLSVADEGMAKRASLSNERNMVYNSMYAVQLVEWLQHFHLGHDMMVIQYEKFNLNKIAGVKEVLDFLSKEGKNDKNLSANGDDTEIVIHNKEKVLERRYRERQFKITPAREMTNLTREYFQRFYSPFNEMLADLLGEEWRDAWVY